MSTVKIRETAVGLRKLAQALATRPATRGMVESYAADLEVLADAMDRADADTTPIMVSPGMSVCPRCLGEGEVLDV